MHRFFKHLAGLTELEPEFENKPAGQFTLPIQLGETTEHIILRVLAPGIRREDLHITIAGQTLTVTGTLPCSPGTYLRQECPCGFFQRSMAMPCLVDSSQTQASLKAGILTITLPRQKRAAPCRIPVQTQR